MQRCGAKTVKILQCNIHGFVHSETCASWHEIHYAIDFKGGYMAGLYFRHLMQFVSVGFYKEHNRE